MIPQFTRSFHAGLPEGHGIDGDRRFLFTPLDKVQLAYLSALEVHPAVFTKMDSSTHSIRSGYH